MVCTQHTIHNYHAVATEHLPHAFFESLADDQTFPLLNHALNVHGLTTNLQNPTGSWSSENYYPTQPRKHESLSNLWLVGAF